MHVQRTILFFMTSWCVRQRRFCSFPLFFFSLRTARTRSNSAQVTGGEKAKSYIPYPRPYYTYGTFFQTPRTVGVFTPHRTTHAHNNTRATYDIWIIYLQAIYLANRLHIIRAHLFKCLRVYRLKNVTCDTESVAFVQRPSITWTDQGRTGPRCRTPSSTPGPHSYLWSEPSITTDGLFFIQLLLQCRI